MPLARPSAHRRSLLLHAGAALLLTATVLYGLGVRFTLTPSVPVGLYRYTDEEPRLGALATFCTPDEAATLALQRGYLHRGRCPGGVDPLGKYVLALPGDTVEVRPQGLRVNGEAVPNSAVLWRDPPRPRAPSRPLRRARRRAGLALHVLGPPPAQLRQPLLRCGPAKERDFGGPTALDLQVSSSITPRVARFFALRKRLPSEGQLFCGVLLTSYSLEQELKYMSVTCSFLVRS